MERGAFRQIFSVALIERFSLWQGTLSPPLPETLKTKQHRDKWWTALYRPSRNLYVSLSFYVRSTLGLAEVIKKNVFPISWTLFWTITLWPKRLRSGIGTIVLFLSRRLGRCTWDLKDQFPVQPQVRFLLSWVLCRDLLWWIDLALSDRIFPKCALCIFRKGHQVWARYLQAFKNVSEKLWAASQK